MLKYFSNGGKHIFFRSATEPRGINWWVSRKRGRQLNAAGKAFNRQSIEHADQVEHVFGVIKWGYRQVRYKGLEKNAAQVFSLMA